VLCYAMLCYPVVTKHMRRQSQVNC